MVLFWVELALWFAVLLEVTFEETLAVLFKVVAWVFWTAKFVVQFSGHVEEFLERFLSVVTFLEIFFWAVEFLVTLDETFLREVMFRVLLAVRFLVIFAVTLTVVLLSTKEATLVLLRVILVGVEALMEVFIVELAVAFAETFLTAVLLFFLCKNS